MKVLSRTCLEKVGIGVSRPLDAVLSFFYEFSDVFRQGVFSLALCAVGDLLAGVSLGFMMDMLRLLPGLMILIPPAIDMRGNIYGALGSRLGTAMHIGVFSPDLKDGVLRKNMQASLLITMLMSVALGFLAKAVAALFGLKSISAAAFVVISVVGGVISGVALLFVVTALAILGYRRNWDFDNVSAPIVTAVGDVVTLPSLYVAAVVALRLPERAISAFFAAFVALAVACTFHGLNADDVDVRRIFRESAPVLFAAATLSTLAGVTIEARLESFLTLPALLITIPPFLAEAGALSGILAARISSMLHIGTASPKLVPEKDVLKNFVVVYIFAAFVFSLVGVSAWAVSRAMGLATPPLPRMGAATLLGGLLCATFLNLFTYYVAVAAFAFGLDPDNECIPITTSTMDVVGVLCILLAITATL
ncbi:MAG: magnesium transporter [Candidatus Alkanophagales archaeon]